MTRADVVPIGRNDLDRVGAFLHENLNPRLSPLEWATSALPPWDCEAPNHGFMLIEDGNLAGVYLAFYSERMLDGRIEKFCNLAAWCVLPKNRLHSLLLLRALLGQKGYHFTDLSPSGNTVPVNERLKFTRLDTTTVLLPNLPWSMPGSGVKVVSDPAAIWEQLDASERRIFFDHRDAAAARHVLLLSAGGHCYVVFRKDRRKGLPVFGSVLYVSNPELFARSTAQFCRHLLLAHGLVATLLELRLIGGRRPGGGILLRRARPRMYRSGTLAPEQIDYLYSELTCVAW